MPNWCANVVRVTDGSERELAAVYDLLKDTENPFAAILPRPQSAEDDWYEWNIANWGTKWDASDFFITRHDDGTLDMTFNTAWSPSLEVTRQLSEDFPSLQIRHFYEECGMCFEGVAAFAGGEMQDNCRDMPSFDTDEETEEYLNTPLEDRLAE